MKNLCVIFLAMIISVSFVIIFVPAISKAGESQQNTTQETTEKLVVHFDVPLEQDLQNYVFDLCKKNAISPLLIFAIIEQESNYNPNALNASEDCFGLMQIHECNFTTYNLDEPYNAFENVRVGITILSELLDKYEDVNKALMAYNCGEYGAKRLWKKGITSNSYSRSVLDKQNEIGQRERVYYYAKES